MPIKKPIRITMTADRFQECLRCVECMTYTEFKMIFGEENGKHLHHKLKNEYEGNIAKFILGLDLTNMESLFSEFQTQLLVNDIAPSIINRGGHVHKWKEQEGSGGLIDICDICGEGRA